MESTVAVKKLREGARLPEYASGGAAGLDLCACIETPLRVEVGRVTRVPTGLAVAIPEGFVGLVRDRSSLALAGLHTLAGVIDSDYRGEVMLVLLNSGSAPIEIHSGDRVAQMLLIPCPRARIEEVTELPPTERGTGGFGSTGR